MNRLEKAEKKVEGGSLISLAAKTGSVIIDATIRHLFVPHGSYDVKHITREEALKILEL